MWWFNHRFSVSVNPPVVRCVQGSSPATVLHCVAIVHGNWLCKSSTKFVRHFLCYRKRFNQLRKTFVIALHICWWVDHLRALFDRLSFGSMYEFPFSSGFCFCCNSCVGCPIVSGHLIRAWFPNLFVWRMREWSSLEFRLSPFLVVNIYIYSFCVIISLWYIRFSLVPKFD